MPKESKDLSGEAIPVHEDFIKLFQDLTVDANKIDEGKEELNTRLSTRIEELQGEFIAELMEIKQRIKEFESRFTPHMDEINEEFAPKIGKVRRESARLKLDFDEAWDNLFQYHEEYRGRAIRYNPDKEVFMFHPEGVTIDANLKGFLNKIRGAAEMEGLDIEFGGIMSMDDLDDDLDDDEDDDSPWE